MTEKRPTRAEKIALRQRVSVALACASEDYLTALTALRDRLAIELDISQSKRDIAALSGQLSTVLVRIAATSKPATFTFRRNPAEYARRRAELEAIARGLAEGRPPDFAISNRKVPTSRHNGRAE
jgi:hypothetical protein